METQSDAEHYAPCNEDTHGSYCLNGGTCVHIVALDEASCRCASDFTGIRCQHYQFSINEDFTHDPTPAIILGCMAAFIVLLCVAVAVVYIRNRKKLRDSSLVEEGRYENAQSPHRKSLTADDNQNTQLQLQELLPKEKKSSTSSRISTVSLATPSKDQNEAGSEEVTPLNTNCNRAVTVLPNDTLYYPKQSTV